MKVVAILYSPDCLILCRKSEQTVIYDDGSEDMLANVEDNTPVFGYKSAGHCWGLPLLDLYLEPWMVTFSNLQNKLLTLESVTLPEGIEAEKVPVHTINSLTFLGLDAYIAWAKLTHEVTLGKMVNGKIVWEK
jgi:hypothetical protein